MINDLIKLANHVDGKGLEKEANYLDAAIKKIAAGGWTIDEIMGGPNPAPTYEDPDFNPTQTAVEPGLDLGFLEDEEEDLGEGATNLPPSNDMSDFYSVISSGDQVSHVYRKSLEILGWDTPEGAAKYVAFYAPLKDYEKYEEFRVQAWNGEHWGPAFHGKVRSRGDELSEEELTAKRRLEEIEWAGSWADILVKGMIENYGLFGDEKFKEAALELQTIIYQSGLSAYIFDKYIVKK